MMPILTTLAVVGGLTAWDVELRLSAGVDGNVLRDRAASRQAALLRLDAAANVQPAPALHLSLGGTLEQALPAALDLGARFTEADLEALLLYRRPLLPGGRLELRLGALGEYGRMRTLFVESLVSQQGIVVLNQLGQHLLVGLRGRVGRADLEGGVQGNYKWTEGVGSYHGAGLRASLGARFFLGAGFAVRARYEYQLRYINGLELLGPAGPDVHLHVNRVGVGAHLQRRIFEGAALYEYGRALDDRAGVLSGDEHRAQVSAAIELFDLWRLEAAGRLTYRSYPERRPEQNLQTSDLQAGASLDTRLWAWRRRLGVFLRYDFSYVDAQPTGQTIPRHAALFGLIGHLQSTAR